LEHVWPVFEGLEVHITHKIRPTENLGKKGTNLGLFIYYSVFHGEIIFNISRTSYLIPINASTIRPGVMTLPYNTTTSPPEIKETIKHP